MGLAWPECRAPLSYSPVPSSCGPRCPLNELLIPCCNTATAGETRGKTLLIVIVSQHFWSRHVAPSRWDSFLVLSHQTIDIYTFDKNPSLGAVTPVLVKSRWEIVVSVNPSSLSSWVLCSASLVPKSPACQSSLSVLFTFLRPVLLLRSCLRPSLASIIDRVFDYSPAKSSSCTVSSTLVWTVRVDLAWLIIYGIRYALALANRLLEKSTKCPKSAKKISLG